MKSRAPILPFVFPFVTCEPVMTIAQLPKRGGLMSKVTRRILSVVVSLMLFSALTMAQTAKNSTDKEKEHHSRFAKVAFWRHHKHADKNAKPAHATQSPSTQPQAKTAQLKPASAKPAAGKNSQNQQHASQMSQTSGKKLSGANKAKAQPKAHDPKRDSL